MCVCLCVYEKQKAREAERRTTVDGDWRLSIGENTLRKSEQSALLFCLCFCLCLLLGLSLWPPRALL